MPLQLRRGTEAERQAMTQPLQEGEPLFITDENKLYIGVRDGQGELPLPGTLPSTNNYSDDDARAAIVAMLEGGLHPNLIYNFDAGSDTFDITVSFDAIAQSVTPASSEAYNLGAYSDKWGTAYVSGAGGVWIGDANVTAPTGSLVLPTGTTVNGTKIILDDQGTIDFSPLTSPPVAPSNGMIAMADGTSWDPAGNGKQALVVRLGGSWVVIVTAP